MHLLLASNNQHKRRELAEILARHTLSTPEDHRLEFDHEEIADTFMGNALGKAKELHELVAETQSGRPPIVIADDSGISVDALDGRPGVWSARFGNSPERPKLTDTDRNNLLLETLENEENRDAHYVCCMVAYLGVDRYYIVQETWHGEIARSPSNGGGGFGYDPVFRLPDLDVTVADISAEEKHRLSHRGKAARRLASLLDGLELDDGLELNDGRAGAS